jgi:hypothetical protein
MHTDPPKLRFGESDSSIAHTSYLSLPADSKVAAVRPNTQKVQQ